MSKIDLTKIGEYIENIEQNFFPLYAEVLKQQQVELVKILKKRQLSKDQIISGTVQGMANLSFQLAVKLSVLLAAAMNNPDFDFEDPENLKLINEFLQ